MILVCWLVCWRIDGLVGCQSESMWSLMGWLIGYFLVDVLVVWLRGRWLDVVGLLGVGSGFLFDWLVN